jgi:hypothetical protein
MDTDDVGVGDPVGVDVVAGRVVVDVGEDVIVGGIGVDVLVAVRVGNAASVGACDAVGVGRASAV